MTIEDIFNGTVKVNDVSIRVVRNYYYGAEETYVTYSQYDSVPALSADDEIQTSILYFDFDIVTKGNWRPIEKEIKNTLKDYGYVWQGTQAEEYDTDTKTIHITTEFAIEDSEVINNG